MQGLFEYICIVTKFFIKVNQVCMYQYTSEQQQFGTKQELTITVGATVKTLCNSGELYA